MTSFSLKIIAIITMVLDHFGDAFFKQTTFFNLIGRFAFPIFAFQITEGYVHTKNLKNYFFRLFLFAIISQIPFMLFRSLFANGISLNIFFTLFFGLLAIFLFDKIEKSEFKLCKKKNINMAIKYFIACLPMVIIGIIAQVLNFDYGFFGIFIIFTFFAFRRKKMLMVLIFILACIFYYTITILRYGYHYLYIFLALFTILPIVFICLYNGKQGKKIKYFLYAFYPVHLLILYLLFH